jgi:hypothetical protein
VIDLPVGLAAWAPQLAVLPSDLALTLAPWIGRLALAVGPLASTHSRHGGDPDGYGGLARRGSYERLVTAEWGIADLFPEEFLRRAAAGEHLFLDRARREPRGALRSIAIVSAGPSQLGAPRLAHIAVLIVLARRAAAAGASFSWGVLEDREHRLIDGLDEAGILRLLAARTAMPADADAFAGWRAALGDGDVWFVGGEEEAPGGPRIIVRDVLEPGVRALEVEVDRRGPSARVRLELPAPDLCARLLRDPYRTSRAPATPRVEPAGGPARDVRFAPGGRRLIVRLASDSFESWPIPSSPRDKVGNPRAWAPPPDHIVVAVGIGHRSILAATVTRDDPTCLELSYSNNHRVRVMLPDEVASELRRQLAEDKPIEPGTCAVLRIRPLTDLVISMVGRLLVVPGFKLWPRPGMMVTAIPFNVPNGGVPVVGSAFFPTRVIWAELHEENQIYVMEGTSSGNQRVAIVPGGPRFVHFGFSLPPSKTWGVMSTFQGERHFSVVVPQRPPMTLDMLGPPIGVCLLDGKPVHVVAASRADDHVLLLETGDLPDRFRAERLPPSTSPFVAATVCPAQPNIAWCTEAGEVVVYSMLHKAVLFRRAPGETS